MSAGTIELYLLRHAHAGDPAEREDDDDQRPLTRKGRRQAKRLGSFMRAVGLKPDALVTSPLVRAAETAQLVARALRVEVLVEPRLAGDLGMARLDEILGELGAERPVLVGHDPDFSALVAMLCGASRIPMKKGALARLDLERPLQPGGGVLRWLVPPDLLRTE
ncbi:MAG: histidine phosphatase family protein [Chloroflexota bacterium]|nr:histidine phosphatase family protein [Chloroflexota bacterium]